MEQVLAGFSGPDPYMLEWLAAICLILVAVAMSLFDLPGNTLMVGCCLGFAFYDPSKYFDILVGRVPDRLWYLCRHRYGGDYVSGGGQCDWRCDRRVCDGVSV